MNLLKKRQLAKLEQIEARKRRQFEKKILAIIENLDTTFTLNELNAYERKLIHELAEKHKLFHQTVNEKLTISKFPFDSIIDVSQMMEKVNIQDERKYNLKNRKHK